ncbi:hypothetical protein DD238_003445 [Peronospora effusa]|uniref:Serine/threonine-protein phosphatase 4 regulatory subunit 3-like central domain-containing protein n=1 Tax=Peronospora effusa TaxID=542832 RepID=A0A3M6VFY1_9STRA|nr:hypothetical protein DD238_003445 [Peronospora effusa]
MAEEYRQRLDNNVEKLVENFKGLVKTAKIKDPANTTRESFQSSIYATTLVQASESLLKLVSEMKLSLALGDFEGMSQNVDTTSEELLKRQVLIKLDRCDDVDAQISHLSSDISSALFELENHFYQSKWRLSPTTDSDKTSIDHLFRDDIKPRDLPSCELENLDEILILLKTAHPTVRSAVLTDLMDKDGAYIAKLLDLFDVSELDADKSELYKLFDVFYAMLEMCNRGVIEILLSDTNFISVVGVFGYNPGLIREMDFRTALEGGGGFNEVIPITDRSVVKRVHMNYRIQVIKDNVLSRSLPDGCVLLLEHMINENSFYILTYISETEDYWKAMYIRRDRETDEFVCSLSSKDLIVSKDKRLDGLGLLKAILNLVRVTKPLDRSQRREPFGAPPVFGSLISSFFGDGEIFAAFATVLGSPDSNSKEIALAVDILNALVFYQGPDRLRAYLASEGKCVPAPSSDNERIVWTSESSLFTALLLVFERDEPMRIQLLNLLRDIFCVPLAQDDKFLSVLYPNYMHWLLQPLKKHTFLYDESAMFDLQDSIMELLTFCTENHGYRVKYLFGRQPIASYAEKMLRSKNKLFVIHAVKFVRACIVRAEAFFSRFLIQNDLFTPMLANLEIGKTNTGAVSSAVLEALSYIEKTNMTSLVEHIYTKFFETYKAECPLVFEAIRARHNENSGSVDEALDSIDNNKVRFVRAGSLVDEEEELYWEKDTETTEPAPELKNGLSEEVSCQNSPRSVKLVDYDDDDDESTAPKDESNSSEAASATSPRGADIDEKRELQLPVRKKKEEEVTAQSFLGGNSVLAHKKAHQKISNKARSPQFKNVFQKISWKLNTPVSSTEHGSNMLTKVATEKKGCNDGSSFAQRDDSNKNSVGSEYVACDDGVNAESAALIVAKRKLALEEVTNSEPLLKKAKSCTPISSS